MKTMSISTEERNAVLWLQRQAGVTKIVPHRMKGTSHSKKHGTAKIAAADPRGVTVRIYLEGDRYRDLYVIAQAGEERDKWIRELENASSNGSEPEAGRRQSVTALKHTVPLAENFSAKVPAPKALDAALGKLYDVTPELAARWLERNTRNRPLRTEIVMRYASDMKAKRWQITGDAIAFDTTGAIVNGQHRLWAVLESGMTVPMLVVFDLDPDVVYVLDDHLKRRLTDVVHIARPDSPIQQKHAACARQMMVSPLDEQRRLAILPKVSRQQAIAFMDRHFDAIEFALRDCFKNKSARLLTNSNIAAVMARAYYTQDRERVKLFGHVVLSGMAEHRDEHMAVAFRNWLQGMAERNLRPTSKSIYAKAVRALRGFLDREVGKRALYEASSELFPLPEEKGSGRKERS